ncbi:DUF6356 family protein [Sphingomonas sp. BN140010]|uniref:DUF6356 family protein n=1 Tax=Sphingomonas arvum TaxID=2992113 RepID=A0ABT3JHJ4_9SPHN|nr:DUF6356 family protein [Sphingomonas sp. BN140010]MCW3798549.1 DUF6356 family protein [Sphingomonas sp. BN140010]
MRVMSDRSIIGASREHLAQAREGYFQHLGFALLVATLLLSAALACLVHALVPGVCRTSASRIVALLSELFRDRERLRPTARSGSGALVLTTLLLLSVPPLLLMLRGGGNVLMIPLGLLCLAVPVAYLRTNPDLEPVA